MNILNQAKTNWKAQVDSFGFFVFTSTIPDLLVSILNRQGPIQKSDQEWCERVWTMNCLDFIFYFLSHVFAYIHT